ncbi:MAG: PAS domain-containing protein [Deinococcota bacterium]
MQLFDHGKLQQFNYSFMKDGITFYRECQLVKRNHDEALVIVRDISAYKRVEDALRIEKEQVLALYEAIPDGITRLNREGVYLDIKPIQGEGSHKPISELLGHTFEENLPPENALIARRYLDRLFQTGQMQRFEAHIEVNGQMRYRETRLVKLNDQEAFALLRDITQQEQIAQHLNNERAHLLALYEAIPDAIIRVSREGQYLSHKPAMYFEPYMSPDATLGQYVHDNTPSDVSKRAYQYLQRLFDTGEMQEFENTLLISGEVRHRENRLVKLNDDEAIVIVRDITSRKRTEEALKTEKEQVLAFYEAIPDGIVRLNRAGIYLDIKPIQAQGTYKPLADLLRHSFDDNLPADIALIAKRHTERLFQTGESQLFAAYMEVAGQLRYRETRMVKLNDNEAIAIVRDLTEQRQAEQALEESKQRLDLAIEAAELGIWDRYANAEEAVVNSHYRRILGLSETSPTQLQAILDDIHPDDVDLVMSDVSGLYDGSKHRISHERRQRHGDGSYRWLRVTGTTVEVDEEAKPLRFVMVIQDIHVQKTLQLQLEATLRELEQTLKEKTVLLAEVHHRVKNNMQIIGSIMSLHAREANQPEAKAALMSSRTRIRTMATIHEVMYNTEVFSDLDFSAYLQTIAQSLVQFSYRDTPSQVGERRQPPELEFKLIPVRLDMQDALPCALIFNELLSNALKHAFPVARATYTSAAPKIYISLNQVGERISLSIRDNGVGVTTTRKNFGSFIVDTLVEQLGGKLELTPAYQDPPEGTQAMLTFDKMTP